MAKRYDGHKPKTAGVLIDPINLDLDCHDMGAVVRIKVKSEIDLNVPHQVSQVRLTVSSSKSQQKPRAVVRSGVQNRIF